MRFVVLRVAVRVLYGLGALAVGARGWGWGCWGRAESVLWGRAKGSHGPQTLENGAARAVGSGPPSCLGLLVGGGGRGGVQRWGEIGD